MPKNLPVLSDTAKASNIWSSFRDRTWFLFGIVFFTVFLPGSIFILINGYNTLAIGVMGLLCIFVINRYSNIGTKAPQLTMAAFVAVLMFVVGLSLVQRGIFGAFWAFPAILIINFMADRRPARIYTAIFLIYISAILFMVLDLPIAARAVTALIVTTLLTNIFLVMIGDLQSKLVEQSNLDPMTGAHNRRVLDSILEEAVERKRRTNTPASMLVMDVDKFKSVNDTYGHAVGDHVLKELVLMINKRARRLDKLFRMGGEEFMLFLPDTDGSGAVTLAEDLRVFISQADLVDDRAITVSIGISEIEHGETIDEWIKRADDALFVAKKSGRNRAVDSRPAERVEASFVEYQVQTV